MSNWKARMLAAVICSGTLLACSGGEDGGADAGSGDIGQDTSIQRDTGPTPDGGGDDIPPLEMVETPSADACGAPAEATLEHAAVADGHCAWNFAENVDEPRGIEVDGAGDVIVVTRGSDDVVALHDDNGNKVIDDGERTTLIEDGPGLNHGLWLRDGYLYASSDTTVYRWPYSDGMRSELTDREVVVDGIPGGGHSTRTLVAREDGDWLYVNIGSAGNVTNEDGRAMVKRFDLTDIPSGGYDAADGEVHADGLRNEVALAFDDRGRLWGMQNGSDNLKRDDLGGDIHADNPGEELNLLDTTGDFHGYPYCWTEYNLPDDVARGRLTQWADPNFMDDGTHDDAWCRNEDNVTPPELAILAHRAPLGIIFYDGDGLDPALDGDLIAGIHGSWNRPVPTGYKVLRIPFDDGEPVRAEPLLEYAGDGDKDNQEWPHRPVEPAVAADGTLLITSDDTDRIFAVSTTEE